MRLNPPDSGSRIRVEGYSRLLQEVAAGSLDGLQCPECYQPSVSVCLSPHQANECRSWLICASCDFHLRLQNAARPRQSTKAKDSRSFRNTMPSL